MTWGRRKDLKIINEQDLEQLPSPAKLGTLSKSPFWNYTCLF